jgi:hypothetical protein
MPPHAPKPGASDTGPRERRIVQSRYAFPTTSPVSLEQGAAPAPARRDLIHAQLIGQDACVALGIKVRATAPVLICRALIAAGHGPGRPLHGYRGNTLCLSVRGTGDAARLEINAKGGFAPLRRVRTAPPVAPSNSTEPSVLPLAGPLLEAGRACPTHRLPCLRASRPKLPLRRSPATGILVSLLLQNGVDPALIRRSLAGPIRVALQFWLERTP